MRRRTAAVILLLCMLFSGCGNLTQGHYVSVEPHTEEGYQRNESFTEVTNYYQLRDALIDIVQKGQESRVISMASYGGRNIEEDLDSVIRYIRYRYPIGAYAVENVSYEIGTVGGVAAVAVTVSYNYNRAEIRGIKQVNSIKSAEALIHTALATCQASIVLQISNYTSNTDYVQIVEDYAKNNPDKVMEIPQVTANIYPESGQTRVVALQFTYQTSRESLRAMQSYVSPVFASAALYVSGDGEARVKFEQLYSLLMERNDYKVETSITPTYSLLRHGVGDSRAFAVVYAAMCSRAGLECQMVSGTRAGEPWFWNMICVDDMYRHVDLLQCHNSGVFYLRTDEEMDGYVWDYSAYPACEIVEQENTGDPE